MADDTETLERRETRLRRGTIPIPHHPRQMTETERKRWHGLPPERIPREKFNWRVKDIRF